VSMVSQSLQFKCIKTGTKQHKICNYGIFIFPSVSRSRCSPKEIAHVICEKTSFSILHSSLKYSNTLADPTGAYIQIGAISSGEKRKVPNLVIANYHSETRMVVVNHTGKSQEEIESLKKEFDIFLKNPSKMSFQINEQVLFPWLDAMPVSILSLVASIEFLRRSNKDSAQS
jgi:hypothetical protein